MAYFHTTVLDNQIKALPTVDTASGSVATFDTDMTENLVEVKCQIVAQQASGTPSPVNPLPIQTYNQLNLAHVDGTDKMSWLQGVTSGIYGIVDLGSLTWTKSAGFFYANLAHKKASSASVAINAICSKYPIVSQSVWASNDKSVWDYTTSNEELICVVDSTYNDLTANQFKTVMNGVYLIYELETPTFPTTYTASDFNAMLTAFGIDGSLYNVPFGQTVANGVLDVTTGKLEITKGFVNMWVLGWILSSSGYFYADYTPIKANSGWITVPDLMCTNYQADTPNNIANKINNERISIWPSGHRVVLYDNNYETPTALVTALQNATSQLVFDLDVNPTIVQLDSTQIQALLNENNIWCDTGDTSVKYILSVGKAIS